MPEKQTAVKHRMRTLVVEDSPEVLKAVCEYLQQRDIVEVVGTALNGEEALAQVEALLPDLVITDLQMPSMGGLQLLLRLRKPGSNRQVIVMTVHEGDMVRNVCTDSGVDGFVPKSRFSEEMHAQLLAAYQRYLVSLAKAS